MIPQYKMEWYIKFGFSTRQIAKMTGESKSNIQYTAQKYGMSQLWEHQQKVSYNFEKIDDPGKAYALGFILCDGSIDLKKNVLYDMINVIPTMLTEAKYNELSASSELIKSHYQLQDNGFA